MHGAAKTALREMDAGRWVDGSMVGFETIG